MTAGHLSSSDASDACDELGVSMMTQIRGTSNTKAKRELGWHPRYASWRDGFRTGLGDVPLPAPITRAAAV